MNEGVYFVPGKEFGKSMAKDSEHATASLNIPINARMHDYVWWLI